MNLEYIQDLKHSLGHCLSTWNLSSWQNINFATFRLPNFVLASWVENHCLMWAQLCHCNCIQFGTTLVFNNYTSRTNLNEILNTFHVNQNLTEVRQFINRTWNPVVLVILATTSQSRRQDKYRLYKSPNKIFDSTLIVKTRKIKQISSKVWSRLVVRVY